MFSLKSAEDSFLYELCISSGNSGYGRNICIYTINDDVAIINGSQTAPTKTQKG